MEDFISILKLDDVGIEEFVKKKILEFDQSRKPPLYIGDTDIERGWINTEYIYLPSGYRSDGFQMTEEFYIEICKEIKSHLQNADPDSLHQRLNTQVLISIIQGQVNMYFGSGKCDETKRKQIYKYDSKEKPYGRNSLGIHTLKGKNVARCIERAAACNGLANFFGMDCSLVYSDITNEDGRDGHAYCLLHDNGEYSIWDTSRYVKMQNGRLAPYKFHLDFKKPSEPVKFPGIQLKTAEFEDIEYDFPWDRFFDAFNVKHGKEGYMDVEEASRKGMLNLSHVRSTIERFKGIFIGKETNDKGNRSGYNK